MKQLIKTLINDASSGTQSKEDVAILIVNYCMEHDIKISEASSEAIMGLLDYIGSTMESNRFDKEFAINDATSKLQ